MGKEKAGRPRVLVRRHVLEIKEDTRDWIEEQLNGLKQAFVVGKVSRSVGDALKGALSHPVGYLSILGGVLISLHTLPLIGPAVVEAERKAAEAAGKTIESFVKDTWRSVSASSERRNEEERAMYERWLNDIWNALRWTFTLREKGGS